MKIRIFIKNKINSKFLLIQKQNKTTKIQHKTIYKQKSQIKDMLNQKNYFNIKIQKIQEISITFL